MELNKFERQLKLMALLAGNTSLTIDDIAARLDISPRSIYRYITMFKDTGFIIEHNKDIYRIDRNSTFFRDISGNVMFSEDEAATVAQILSSVNDNSTRIKSLKNKLDRIYNYRILDTHDTDRRIADNTSLLYEAVKQRLVVVLESYRSLRGNSISDRIVEPYQFLNSNDDIRCYEISAKQNKTFKISRIGKVRLLDIKWNAEPEHDNIYTDVFGFTGIPIDKITLSLTPRAAALLCEEHPQARQHMSTGNENREIFSDKVCSYLGAMRFVFGLFEDVKVMGSENFSAFLMQKAEDLTHRIGKLT